jgi:hypothetical protein
MALEAGLRQRRRFRSVKKRGRRWFWLLCLGNFLGFQLSQNSKYFPDTPGLSDATTRMVGWISIEDF